MKNFRLELGDDLLIVFAPNASLAQLCWFNRIEPLIDDLKGVLRIHGRPLSFKDSSKISYLQVTRKNHEKWSFSMKDHGTTLRWLVKSLEMMIDEQELKKLHPEPLKT